MTVSLYMGEKIRNPSQKVIWKIHKNMVIKQYSLPMGSKEKKITWKIMKLIDLGKMKAHNSQIKIHILKIRYFNTFILNKS